MKPLERRSVPGTMERRFDAVLDGMLARRAEGEPFDQLLHSMSDRDLVAALAAAGKREPMLANVLATELLNRIHRVPFLGAFYVSATLFAAIFVFDWILAGEPFVLTTGPHAVFLAILTAALAILSLMMLMLSRGRLKRLGHAIRRAGRRSF